MPKEIEAGFGLIKRGADIRSSTIEAVWAALGAAKTKEHELGRWLTPTEAVEFFTRAGVQATLASKSKT